MEQLLRIFYNNGSFITFVGLQLLCMYLIINNNSPQSKIFAETMTVRGGSVNDAISGVNSYLDLEEQNQVLQREIARLKGLLPEAQYNTEVAVDSIDDRTYLQRYTFLAANIVNRSPYRPNNTCVIDRGTQLGVKQGQGVVDNQGLIGIVDLPTERHARVISILHRATRISAGLSNGHYGTLLWDGQDPRRMTVTDIPDYAEVSPGDTIYTTGYSNVFPTGQVIGTVENTEIQPGTGSQHLNIVLANEPLNSANAYVVQDLFKEELETLKQR
ncbi:rod shape-determining protein MreC [Neolewinella persica]|uniref:rod shape-determining protein MreC n=1 Tax=Neolewinella persica TaxID=70998 RepID=UPI00036C40D0|nr:rod shape-determining protein MreC [Neolewinella persica]